MSKKIVSYSELQATPIAPLVHMNGDNGERLLDYYTDAMRAISKAMEEMPEVNGRNYYPMGDGALTAALDQRDRWTKALRAIRDEIEAVAVKISDQL